MCRWEGGGGGVGVWEFDPDTLTRGRHGNDKRLLSGDCLRGTG